MLDNAIVADLPAGRLAAADRIEVIDSLRGFALFGIICVHMVEQYMGGPPPPSHPNFGTFSPVDSAVSIFVGVLFIGKFVAIFSLLFGLSFFIQMDRAAQKGRAFRGRFLWRLAILFAIGAVHHLFYRGDILTIYALLGLTLVLAYRASDRTLLVTAVLLGLGLPRLLVVGLDAVAGTQVAAMVRDEAASQVYFDTLKGGSLPALFVSNAGEGFLLKLQFLFGLFGRGYQTLALFLVGLYIGRRRWHESLPEFRGQIRRIALWGLAACVLCAVAGATVFFLFLAGKSPDELTPWHFSALLTLNDLFTLGLMSAMAGGFLMLYFRPAPRRALRWLSPVGRTALTTYLCQTVAGTALLYGYGANLLGEIGSATALLIGLGIFLAQIIVSAAWLRHFQYGPVEWLWRSLTFGRIQPLYARRDGTVVPAS